MNRCENALLDCILACDDDVGCLSECIRLETECTNGKSDSSFLYQCQTLSDIFSGITTLFQLALASTIACWDVLAAAILFVNVE